MSWDILERLLTPFEYIQLSSKRIFYVFLLSSLGLIFLRAALFKEARSQLKTDMKALLGWRIWSHRSSLVDLKCLFFNYWLYAFLLAPFIWNAKFILVWLAYGLDQVFEAEGVLNHWPQWSVTLLYTFVLFTISDLSRYALHYAFHRFSWLWRFHKVHHSADVLTPLTLYRAHPVEMILYKFRAILVVGSVSGVFYFLFEGKMQIWHILGVNALGFVFNFLGSNLRHSQVWFPFGRLEHVFISPAQHQMHHSRDIRMARSNIGSCFAIWDKCFGTFQLSEGVKKEDRHRFGLEYDKLNHNQLSWASSVFLPFVKK